MAELSVFRVDYTLATPEEWNEACKLSGPDLFGYEPQPAEPVPVFGAVTTERALCGAPLSVRLC